MKKKKPEYDPGSWLYENSIGYHRAIGGYPAAMDSVGKVLIVAEVDENSEPNITLYDYDKLKDLFEKAKEECGGDKDEYDDFIHEFLSECHHEEKKGVKK